MSGITIIWSMIAAASATLAIIYGVIWLSRRNVTANGWFALMAGAIAAMTLIELALMKAATPADWSALARWYHVPTFVMIVALVGFVRSYLRAGRLWLAWTVCIIRAISLILDFTTGENLNFRHVSALRHVPFLGELAAIGEGERNPMMIFAQIGLVAAIAFVLDATIQVWRRGDHRRALTVGGATTFFALMASTMSALTLWGVLDVPVMPSVFFIGVVTAMGVELGRDILHAERLATELREEGQRLTLAAEAAKLGVWTRDPVRGTIWASRHWRKLFGFAEAEPLSFDRVLDRVHPDDRAAVQQILGAPLRNDLNYDLEYRIVRPDGSVRWISSHGRFENNGDSPSPARGVSVDVTERKLAELEVEERRTELTHLARVAMLGELSGSLAHELNQPLTAILSNAQAALRFLTRPDFDRKEIEEILRDIVAADQRAGEVIRSLRALFRKDGIQRTSLNVNAFVEDTLQLVRSDVLNRNIALAADFCIDTLFARGDRVQLQQVLMNLVFNAADAVAGADKERRRVIVSTRRTAGGVGISVRDTGGGIPVELKERIFEPFFTTKPQGMGLGLAVCNSILSAHGSRLEVADHADGAEFFFVLTTEESA